MGQLKLSTASGGSITLDPTNTASNLTITVPAVTGTIITTASSGQSIPKAALPTGSVLQVVQTNYAVAASSSSTSFVDTGLSASITPTSATSKILVLVSHGDCAVTQTGNGIKIVLFRNSTNLAASSNNQLYGQTVGAGFNIGATSSINYLDSPATTSSLTYKTQYAPQSSGSTAHVFRDGTMGGITLMEIAA